jgi:hypothetical protein
VLKERLGTTINGRQSSTDNTKTHVTSKMALFATLFWFAATATAFPIVPRSPTTPTRQRHSSLLHITTTSTSATSASTIKEQVLLSEVDARVLKQMLSDEVLQGDVRLLLERGVIQNESTRQPTTTTLSEEEENNSNYSSNVMRKFADTKLWKKLSVQAELVLESIAIWAQNKVENDVRVVAALGLFAWDRAARDVARALPETITRMQPKQMFQLTNTSSYKQPSSLSSTRSILQRMNAPADEIQSVTRSILDIVKANGRQQQPFAERTLRTVAPARERQRRAYHQRKRLLQQDKNVLRMATKATDTVWELRQELQAESSPPGYKTATLRTSIAAGVSSAGNLLSSVRQQAKLVASQKAVMRLQHARDATEDARAELLKELQTERTRIYNRLRACIEEPEHTWLRDEVVSVAFNNDDDTVRLSADALQQVVALMILVRDNMNACDKELNLNDSFSTLLSELHRIRGQVNDIRARAAEAVSYTIAEQLWQDLIGMELGAEMDPVILRLSEIETSYAESFENVVLDTSELEAANAAQEAVMKSLKLQLEEDLEASGASGYHLESDSAKAAFVGASPEYVDVEPVMYTISNQHSIHYRDDVDTASEAGNDRSVMAELITDDDDDSTFAMGPARNAAEYNEQEEMKLNLVLDLTLRAFDVVFFMLEKTFTVLLPKSLEIGKTVSQRLQGVSNYEGTRGWKIVSTTTNAKGRY